MSVIQFESTVEGNLIRIPEQYMGQIPDMVTVTLGDIKKTQLDLLEAIEDTRLRRNLSRPYKTAQEAVTAMLEE